MAGVQVLGAGLMSGPHKLTRTSPKSGPFIGTCIQCERENLPAAAAHWPCDSDRLPRGEDASSAAEAAARKVGLP